MGRIFKNLILGIVALLCVAGTIDAILTTAAMGENGASANLEHGVWTGNRTDAQTAAYRTDLSGGDSTTINGTFFTNVPSFKVNGFGNVSVTGHFSSAAASCVVELVGVYVDPSGTNYLTVLSNPITLTAGADTDAAGKHLAPSVYLTPGGANACRIRLVSITAGTVDLWAGSF